jgi:hypothetical protein
LVHQEVLEVFWNVVDNMFYCSANLADVAKRQMGRQEVKYFECAGTQKRLAVSINESVSKF